MLLMYLGFTVYVVICLVVASYGRNRRIGITGFFLIGLLLTPVAVALMLLVTSEGGRPPAAGGPPAV